jgi:hypothetical protein
MNFTNPIWLWGFVGLIIPVAIHLLSLKEGKIVYIGSLRHLRESNTAQFSSIRLNELLLLLIRILLITSLVLFLAGLHFNVNSTSAKKWVVVDRNVVNDRQAKILIDSLAQDHYEIRLLENGFPPIKDSSTTGQSKNNWVLAQQLAKLDLDDAVVLSNNYAKDFRGQRIQKPANIKWITIEPDERKFEVTKLTIGKDSIWSRVAESSSAVTRLKSSFTLASNNQETENKIRIMVHADDKFKYDAKIIFAALKSIDEVTPFRFLVTDKFDTTNLHAGDWVIWLSEDALNLNHDNVIIEGNCMNGNTNVFQRGVDAKLRCPDVKSHWWIITKRLNEEVFLNEGLNAKLASILLAKYRSSASGQRSLPDRIIWSKNNSENKLVMTESGSADILLMILFATTLLTERILAQRRNQ